MYHYHTLVEAAEARRRDQLEAASRRAMRPPRAGVRARLGRQLVLLGERMLSSNSPPTTQPACSVN